MQFGIYECSYGFVISLLRVAVLLGYLGLCLYGLSNLLNMICCILKIRAASNIHFVFASVPNSLFEFSRIVNRG